LSTAAAAEEEMPTSRLLSPASSEVSRKVKVGVSCGGGWAQPARRRCEATGKSAGGNGGGNANVQALQPRLQGREQEGEGGGVLCDAERQEIRHTWVRSSRITSDFSSCLLLLSHPVARLRAAVPHCSCAALQLCRMGRGRLPPQL